MEQLGRAYEEGSHSQKKSTHNQESPLIVFLRRSIEKIQNKAYPNSITMKKREMVEVGRLKSSRSLMARVGSRVKRRKPAAP